MFEITVEDYFSAAHRLRGYQGRCEELHGHNWRVQASIQGEKVDKLGMLLDFKKVKARLKVILQRLDHHYLNEIPPFDKLNPTSENLARFIFEELKKNFVSPPSKLARVTVWETERAFASYSEI